MSATESLRWTRDRPTAMIQTTRAFFELKAAREESERASERKRQSILRKEIEWMQRGARARSTKQKAHIQRYEALRDQKGPQTDGKG